MAGSADGVTILGKMDRIVPSEYVSEDGLRETDGVGTLGHCEGLFCRRLSKKKIDLEVVR